MKVGFLQTKPVFGDITGNVDGVVKKILKLDADLLVLPELFSTGYQFKNKKEAIELAEPVPHGYATRALMEVAREKKTFIVAGLSERAGRRVYNSAVLVGPKGFIGLYRKAHIFWNEKDYFSPGDTPFEVYNIGKARVGMMICFDWLFPEVARTLALKGADIICQPSNLVLPHCPDAMITRCLENRVFAVTANRVGTERRVKGALLKFTGLSQVVTPAGKLLFRASSVKAQARIFTIDPKKARDKYVTPRNHAFKDRRTDLFEL